MTLQHKCISECQSIAFITLVTEMNEAGKHGDQLASEWSRLVSQVSTSHCYIGIHVCLYVTDTHSVLITGL